MASLQSVTSKILWAEKHRQALNTEVTGYFQRGAGFIIAEVDPQLYGVGIKGFWGPTVPESIPLLVGDVLQNLRSALDYLVWELCLSANGSPTNDNAFPVCKAPEAFKKSLKRNLLQGVPEEAIAEIELLQPYHSGEAYELTSLWGLNTLTNINKHRRILLAGLDVSVLDPISMTSGYTSLGTGFPENVYMNEGLTASIQFKEGVLIGQEVSSALHGMIDYVRSFVTPKFERFFG